MPPSVIVKRQEYRHVDYAQFINQSDISNFVTNWMESGRCLQRVGYLYGYYAEDPNYKNGVRAIVEAIYEPPQKNEMNSFEILPDPDEQTVDMIAAHLSFERIGW
jgi:nuclear protein localization family protein 4